MWFQYRYNYFPQFVKYLLYIDIYIKAYLANL